MQLKFSEQKSKLKMLYYIPSTYPFGFKFVSYLGIDHIVNCSTWNKS